MVCHSLVYLFYHSLTELHSASHASSLDDQGLAENIQKRIDKAVRMERREWRRYIKDYDQSETDALAEEISGLVSLIHSLRKRNDWLASWNATMAARLRSVGLDLPPRPLSQYASEMESHNDSPLFDVTSESDSD